MISHSPEQAAIASELLQRLTVYEDGLRELLQRRWDPELDRQLADDFDHMQMLSTLLPRLATRWNELMLTRLDLTHALWTSSSPSRINGKVVGIHARHRALIEEVRHKCLDYVAKGQRAQGAAVAGSGTADAVRPGA